MTTLMEASRQWSSRPADERFTSLDDLRAAVARHKALSNARVISSRKLEAIPVDGDHKALVIQGEDGIFAPTNWSFGQVAARAKAPAYYLKGLPSPLAADCINFGLRRNDVEEVGMYWRDDLDGRVNTLAAATGPAYGRIYNLEVVDAVMRQFGNGRDGAFRVPGEFGKAVEVTKANTTLYASDRDMFIFLADEENRIEMKNRRDGKPGSLARGFFIGNSEVGSAALGIWTFLFDYVCCNRMVWGAEEIGQVRIRHTSGAPDRFIEEVAPALEVYRHSSTSNIQQALTDARAKRIDDVDAFLANRFSAGQVKGIKLAHEADENRPIETIWDAVTGITAYARGIEQQDSRIQIEREAGKVFKLAA